MIRKSKKNRQHNGHRKRTKGQTKIYKTRTPLITGMNSCAPEG